MTLKVETQYPASIPQTAVLGFAPRGLAWHWTAGTKGRAGAEGTVRHFQATRYTVNASYSILLWHEHRADLDCTTVAWWIVPATKAAHSMNPASAFMPKTNSATEQARFAEVHRILARDSDPNADTWSLSYCGMPADLALDLKCLTFRNDLRALARQLISHPTFIAERPHFGHGWIQPTTRYEMDQVGLDFMAMLYQEQEGATAPLPEPIEEDTLPALRPVRQQWTTGTGDTLAASVSTTPGGQFWTLGPDQGERKFFTAPEKVWTIAESLDGRWRAVEYGREILWMHRYNLRPIAGTRNPASGFGLPSVGFTLAHVEEAEKAARNVGFVVGRDKAAAAAKAVTP